MPKRNRNVDLRDIAAISKRLAPGEIDSRGVDRARDVLASFAGDIESALYIVGINGNRTDETLVKRYLEDDLADAYGELALKCICRYMDLGERYTRYIKMLLFSDRDIWTNSRFAAIIVAKDCLKHRYDREIVERLAEIASDFEDCDRIAARNELVVILNLENSVKEPTLVSYQPDDSDLKTILSEIKRKLCN